MAAHLAAGLAGSKLGPLVRDAMVVTTDGPLRTGRRFWQGEIAYVDRYGNLITNLPVTEFPEVMTRTFALKIGFESLSRLHENYSTGSPDEPVVVIGSSGNLEVAVNQGDAARRLGVGLGSPVELEIR